MLDAVIIEEIRRREEQREERAQPRLEQPGRFPLPPPQWRRDREEREPEESDRGFVILDM